MVVAAIAFGGYLAFPTLTGAARDDQGQITDAGRLSAFDLHEGDCFDDPTEADEVTHVTALPCSEPHDLEAFLTFMLPMGEDAPFPGDEYLERQVDERCLPAFVAFVDVAFKDSELDVISFQPTPDSWVDGDREMLCAVGTMDGSKLEGSAQGSRR